MANPDRIDLSIKDNRMLIQAIHKELIALRGAFGKLNVQKFSQYPNLRAVCGDNDLADDFLVFEREMERIIAESNRDEAAAVLSITAPYDLMLHRLEYVVEHFKDDSGETREQRTARRWSDRGMLNVATELVTLAQMKGWLGRENLAFELSGNRDGLLLSVWYFYSEELDGQTPVVSIWKISGEEVTEESIEIERPLSELKTLEALYKAHRLEQYQVPIELPEALARPEISDDTISLLISIDTVGAPMRTLTFVDETDLSKDLRVEFSVYREIAMIELRKRTPDPSSQFLGLQSG